MAFKLTPKGSQHLKEKCDPDSGREVRGAEMDSGQIMGAFQAMVRRLRFTQNSMGKPSKGFRQENDVILYVCKDDHAQVRNCCSNAGER